MTPQDSSESGSVPAGVRRSPTPELYSDPKRPAWAWIVGVALAAFALGLRIRGLGADPPAWLGTEALLEGVSHAQAAYAEQGAAFAEALGPGRVLSREAIGRSLALFGFSPTAYALPHALCGALTVLVAFALLLRVAGLAAATLGGVALAIDPLAIAWSQAGHPNVLAGLLGLGAIALAATSRIPILGTLLGLALVAAAAHGITLNAGLFAIGVLAIGVQSLARRRTERGRPLLWLMVAGISGAALLVIVASPQLLEEGMLHLRSVLVQRSLGEIVARLLAAPAAARFTLLIPALTFVALAAPLLVRGSRSVGKRRRTLERALITQLAFGLVAIGIFDPTNASAAAMLHPGLVVLVVLTLDTVARGGARTPRHPGLTWFLWGIPAGFLALDALSLAGDLFGPSIGWRLARAIDWLRVPGPAALGHRLLLAGGGAALLAGLLSARGRLHRRSPPHPRFALALAALHVLPAGWLAWSGPAYAPRTLAVARRELAAITPPGARVQGPWAAALLMGQGARLAACDRPTHALVEPSAVPLPASVRPVASLYALGRRLSVVRLANQKQLAASPFEAGRFAFEPAGGGLAPDLALAAERFAQSAARHPNAPLPHALRALVLSLDCDRLGRASAASKRALAIAPNSVPALLVSALLLGKRARYREAALALRRAHAHHPAPSVLRIAERLERALEAADADALYNLTTLQLPLLVADQLR